MKERVSIIGFGRFGMVLADLLKNSFDVVVYDCVDKTTQAKKSGVLCVSLQEALASPTLFYAVPISHFENILKKHVIYFKEPKTIIDVLSVKTYPKTIMETLLPKNCEGLLTHPLFGPDSVEVHGIKGLPIVIDQFSSSNGTYSKWKTFFLKLGLEVIEMSAEEHDKKTAYSQGLAHFIGRVLEDMHTLPTSLDTIGVRKLFELKKQTCNDTWELFTDLQLKNPYTKEMRIALGTSVDTVFNKLLPNRINTHTLVIGIQGGKGSFNEQAAHEFVSKYGITDFKLVYLYTSENVLSALFRGDVDRGLFAVHNAVGGVVEESIKAMARYRFSIVEEFPIVLTYALMVLPGIKKDDITTIMSHPQKLKQCNKTLEKRYPSLKKMSGTGDMIDDARVAEELLKENVPKTTAILGSHALARVCGLSVIDTNLEDEETNITRFLLVERNS